MKKGTKIFWASVVVLAAAIAYAVYLFWSQGALQRDADVVNDQIVSLKNEVLRFENQRVQEAISAKEIVGDLRIDEIRWSKVIKTIRKTIPEKRNKPLLNVLSYSSGGSNNITMSVKTTSGSDDPYADVAALIKEFDESSEFTDSFVPSISSGTDDEGNEILSFSFTTVFIPEDQQKALQEEITEILDESLEEPKITR